jgi:hypothetical protein
MQNILLTQIKKKIKDKESLVLNNNHINHEENKKIKLAYDRLHIHISAFDDFSEFESYFNDIKKTQDDKELNKWLLKVLFLKLKEDKKHPFDLLLEKITPAEKVKIEKWLEDSLNKFN